jgi:hypothetical protein
VGGVSNGFAHNHRRIKVGERIVAFFLAFAVLWMVFYFIAKLMRS